MVVPTPAITISGLSKRYGSSAVEALSNLDLAVKQGEIYGFLGPNGAGKSTTIRLLLNFIQPTAGGAQILGKDIVRDSVDIKRLVGYLSGEVALYPKMTGQQFLDYMAELQPLKTREYLRELGLRFQANLKMKIRELSRGNRQKIGIIQAFMHQPEILILDEPTVGLDPLMQEEFFKLLKETQARGASVFFSSHNLAEVQKICDRVAFIREGKLVAEQSIDEASATAARTFDIVFAEAVPREELRSIPGAKAVRSSAKQATIRIHGELKPLFRVLARHRVVAINQRELNLEEEFLRFYQGVKK